MNWAKQQRQAFIGETVRAYGRINRSDLIEKFSISTPQASLDLRSWRKANPGAIEYNLTAKRCERVAQSEVA